VHLISFMLGSLPVMMRQMFWRPHVVFSVVPTFFCVPLTLFVGKSSGAACWLHVQDFEVDAAFELGLLPSQGLIHYVAVRIEKILTGAFDRVSVISSKMADHASTKTIPTSRIVVFPNWVDVDMIYPLDPMVNGSNVFRRELAAQVPQIDKKIILLYSGNMGVKQGLELLAPLAESFLSDFRVHFLFCGDGAFRSRLEALVGHFTNVTLLPLQPLDRLNELLGAADVHLLLQRASAADLVMPSRLGSMLSSGRPVIATADMGTQVAQVVEGRGLIVPTEDASALRSAILRLVEDEGLRLSLGRSAREYAVKNLGKQQVLNRFNLELVSLLH